ncbi:MULTISPECIES: hypothetical protein [unclassified Bradyrhizobium]|uniref:hypothetical protein n=1 Tax=unclassified Bradyrhizobium TaxID=2631580 RepID=UPI002FF2F97E
MSLAEQIWKLLAGQRTAHAQSSLGHVLIHICMTQGWEKQGMIEALSEQWDMYEKQFNEARQADQGARH